MPNKCHQGTLKFPGLSLPLRQHQGCDPLCEECQEWTRDLIEMMGPAVAEAERAYMQVIAKHFPELVSFSNHGGMEFSIASSDFALDIAETTLFDIVKESTR